MDIPNDMWLYIIELSKDSNHITLGMTCKNLLYLFRVYYKRYSACYCLLDRQYISCVTTKLTDVIIRDIVAANRHLSYNWIFEHDYTTIANYMNDILVCVTDSNNHYFMDRLSQYFSQSTIPMTVLSARIDNFITVLFHSGEPVHFINWRYENELLQVVMDIRIGILCSKSYTLDVSRVKFCLSSRHCRRYLHWICVNNYKLAHVVYGHVIENGNFDKLMYRICYIIVVSDGKRLHQKIVKYMPVDFVYRTRVYDCLLRILDADFPLKFNMILDVMRLAQQQGVTVTGFTAIRDQFFSHYGIPTTITLQTPLHVIALFIMLTTYLISTYHH